MTPFRQCLRTTCLTCADLPTNTTHNLYRASDDFNNGRPYASATLLNVGVNRSARVRQTFFSFLKRFVSRSQSWTLCRNNYNFGPPTRDNVFQNLSPTNSHILLEFCALLPSLHEGHAETISIIAVKKFPPFACSYRIFHG